MLKTVYAVSIYFYTDGDWSFKAQEGSGGRNTYGKYYANTALDRIVDYADQEAAEKAALEGREEEYDGEWVVSYKNYSLLVDVPGYAYAFGFESRHENRYHEAVNTFKALKRDLYYTSHEWVREDFDQLMDEAIAFVESGKTGDFVGTLRGGNWQPSIVAIHAHQEEVPE